MSGNRRLIADRIELLANHAIVGPVDTHELSSASAIRKLGNNPRIFVANVTSSNLPAGSGPINLGILSAAPSTPYFDANDSFSSYLNVLTQGTGGSANVLSSASGMAMKAVIHFEGFAMYNAALVSTTEVTLGIHITDNLGNTWDKTFVVLFNVAAGAAGKSFSISFPIVTNFEPARSSMIFNVASDNPAAQILSLSGLQLSIDVSQ